jgi:DNA-binding LytR/AlgR family response regulator
VTATALIVEDEPLLRAALRQHLAELWPQLDVSREAEDGIAAIKMIGERLPDVIFLDIHVPVLNGLEVARLVSGRCHVVFVTAYQEHAVTAFEEGAVDFVVKPIERDRLAVTVARLRQRLTSVPANLTEVLRLIEKSRRPENIRWIQASVGTQIRIVPVEDVIYFQSDAKYTKVVTKRGELHIRRSIKELLEGLDPNDFWQIHRGTIVNAKCVDSVSRSSEQMRLRLVGRGEKLSVSEPYQFRFRRQ